ncbi:protein kinase [Streptomyces sp. NBC_00075]|uniref:serine/threonine-protein kinase n=1 Tax=Streptomyces sp. NBC_00075 TaxID=2975641 RepID=UPI00324FDD51
MLDLSGSGAGPLELRDPVRIGPIPIVGRLGSGGTGRVYLGVTEGRYTAVKLVLPELAEDEVFLQHFGQELDNLSRLPATATAPLLASDRDARPPWLATAYVPGLTLGDAIEAHGGGLPADALWLLLGEIASKLAAVHAMYVVHRDLKPSNIMLTLGGVTLIDFGFARATGQNRLTRTGMVVGTPAYMSPEQASGARQFTGATDVFALGLLLLFAASGKAPFGDGAGVEVLYRIVHQNPDLRAVRALDRELAEVVASCLDKDPEKRPSAAELLERAANRGPSGLPLWPRPITNLLDQRESFAATVPHIDEPDDQPDAPDAPSEPVAEEEPPSEKKPPSAEAGSPPQDVPSPRPSRRERRRVRALLTAVPVVLVGGTTLVVQLLPYVTAQQDETHATPSVSASASAKLTSPTPGTSASRTAKPSPSPSASRTSEGNGGGSGSVQGSGDTDGSNDSDENASQAGSGNSSGSASKPTGGTPTSAASGTYRFRNGSNNQCLTGGYGPTGTGNCTDTPAVWTVERGSDGTFMLVNQDTDLCLRGGQSGLGTCDKSASVSWRNGSGGSLRSVADDACLDVNQFNSFATTSTCDSAATSQRWTKMSA